MTLNDLGLQYLACRELESLEKTEVNVQLKKLSLLLLLFVCIFWNLQALLDVLEGQLQDCHRLAGSAATQMAFVP